MDVSCGITLLKNVFVAYMLPSVMLIMAIAENAYLVRCTVQLVGCVDNMLFLFSSFLPHSDTTEMP